MKNVKIIVAAVAFVVCGIIFSCSRNGNDEVTDLSQMQEETTEIEDSGAEDSQGDAETDSPQEACFVYVCGAVGKPGVIELPEGSRVGDAIDKAGGLIEGAAPEYLNLAEPVCDGGKIYVPTQEEIESSGTSVLSQSNPQANAGNGAESAKININTATAQELKTLSGIGDKKAADIINFRESHGNFTSIEDIMQVPGIKNAAFEKIKDDITI